MNRNQEPEYKPNPKFKHLTFPLAVTVAASTVTFTNQKFYDMAYAVWGFNLSSNPQDTVNGRFVLQINSNWYVPKSPIDGLGANAADYSNFHINAMPNGFHGIDCETVICKPDSALIAAEVLKYTLKNQNPKFSQDELEKAGDELLCLYPDEHKIRNRAIRLDNAGTFNFEYTDTTIGTFTAYTLFLNFWVAVNG